MDTIHIRGGNPLFGETKVQGSKNAVLPIMAAALLIEGTSVIRNCPRISDVYQMQTLLEDIGCKVTWGDRSLEINASRVNEKVMNGEAVTEMRSSIMLLGAMLGRIGEVSLVHPGGCVIGERPIDLHLEALRKMGVTIQEEECSFTAVADRLTGGEIRLPIASVGATENVLLSAVKADGVTVLKNAAKEPEIVALCNFLIRAGAEIDGAGTDTLKIKGVKSLHPTEFSVPPDRIVAGTYLAGVLGAGGHVFLEDAPVEHMEAMIAVAGRMGAEIYVGNRGMSVIMEQAPKPVPYLKTEVYPGFPTDMQSLFMAALTRAKGYSVLEEDIFENRFRIVPELQRMGADIAVDDKKAVIQGKACLKGTYVTAEELRGGAALVIAGCMAEGETIVGNRHFISRGYEDIVRDLRNLGVKINVQSN